jgi:hypothetical protein
MMTLQRLTEHLIAAFFSIQASRTFDSSALVTLGCLNAVADSLIRKIAMKEPSVVSCHLQGRTLTGRQLGHTGFGLSIDAFVKQVFILQIRSFSFFKADFRVKHLNCMHQNYV